MKKTKERKVVSPFAKQLRYWRNIRGLSQLHLALKADSTPRYISFMETGRSRPREQMVLRLADALEIPLRERNDLLQAAGLGIKYPHYDVNDEELKPYQSAIQFTLKKQEPYPAWVINRWYDIVDSNEAMKVVFAELFQEEQPNLIELIYGDTPFRNIIDNWDDVAFAFAYRLKQELTGSPVNDHFRELVEFSQKQMPKKKSGTNNINQDCVICPTYKLDGKLIRTIVLIAQFGAAREVTIDELSVYMMYPYDEEGKKFFHKMSFIDK